MEVLFYNELGNISISLISHTFLIYLLRISVQIIIIGIEFVLIDLSLTFVP